jgi:hypothetical protein
VNVPSHDEQQIRDLRELRDLEETIAWGEGKGMRPDAMESTVNAAARLRRDLGLEHGADGRSYFTAYCITCQRGRTFNPTNCVICGGGAFYHIGPRETNDFPEAA